MPRNTFAAIMAVIVLLLLVVALVSGEWSTLALATIFAGVGVTIYSSLPKHHP